MVQLKLKMIGLNSFFSRKKELNYFIFNAARKKTKRGGSLSFVAAI